jgi:hypothetical protein
MAVSTKPPIQIAVAHVAMSCPPYVCAVVCGQAFGQQWLLVCV